MQKQQAQYLPKLLSNMVQKRLSLCFRKILLFEPQNDDKQVKHYDLQCQGVILIEGVLKAKIQSLQMKALQLIKTIGKKNSMKSINRRCGESYMKNATQKQIIYRDQMKHNSFTRLSNSYRSDFEPSFMNCVNNNQKIQMQNSHNQSSLNLNSKYSNCLQEKYYPELLSSKDANMSDRNRKRMLILQKLNNIERDISDVASIDEAYSQKSIRMLYQQNENISNYSSQLRKSNHARSYYHIQ